MYVELKSTSANKHLDLKYPCIVDSSKSLMKLYMEKLRICTVQTQTLNFPVI